MSLDFILSVGGAWILLSLLFALAWSLWARRGLRDATHVELVTWRTVRKQTKLSALGGECCVLPRNRSKTEVS